MTGRIELSAYLAAWAGGVGDRAAVAATIEVIAEVSAEISALIGAGELSGALTTIVGDSGSGDVQKALDRRAHELFAAALADVPVAYVGSEEATDAAVLDASAPLAVAMDPLDGSSNIETNVSIGTIFAILPALGTATATFAQPGLAQRAAGFVIYGPQTALALTVGNGTQIFTLDRGTHRFLLTRGDVRIPEGQREFAINASNYRHWNPAIRDYVDDLVAGETGPRGDNFNMRWIASLVAEAYRVLVRGGIFLYPRDSRPDYRGGRLRLVYEANPIAFLVEQAGGSATDGERRILELVPDGLHARSPLIFGSADKVARVARYHQTPTSMASDSPLFGKRGLFRN
jgi:fructose-1,6-bisphosphatase I